MPTYQGASHSYTGTSATPSLTVPKPAALAAGDYLFFFVCDAAAGLNDTIIGTNFGWSELATPYYVSGSGSMKCHAFYVGPISNPATQPSAYTIAFWNANTGARNGYGTAICLVYRGVNDADIVDAYVWNGSTASDFTNISGSMTLAQPNEKIIVWSVFQGPSGGITDPVHQGEGVSTWKVRLDTNTVGSPGTYGTAVVADQTLPFSGNSSVWTNEVATNGDGPKIFLADALNNQNTAPNTPASLYPASSVTLDRSLTQRFSWSFSDPNPGDSQTQYELRYRPTGTSTWTTVGPTTSTNQFHDFAGNTFAADDWEWQVRYRDNGNGVSTPLWSSWSSSAFFVASNAPGGPTITQPINGGTVTAPWSTVAWSIGDQDSYQFRRVADNAGAPNTGTIYYDTGEQASPGARALTVNFETNGRYEHVQVRVKDGGLWSPWSSNRVLINYTPPAAPLLNLTADDNTASILLSITNPTPTGGQPAVSYNDIYIDDGDGLGFVRRASLLQPNQAWTYWLPRSGFDYTGKIFVRAIATTGATSDSEL